MCSQRLGLGLRHSTWIGYCWSIVETVRIRSWGFTMYWGGSTSVFLQQHFSIFATSFLHFCNTFHPHWGSTELLWLNDAINVTSQTRGPNRPPLVQKNVTSQTRGPNQPSLIKKMSRHRRGVPTDLLWSKKTSCHKHRAPTKLLDV